MNIAWSAAILIGASLAASALPAAPVTEDVEWTETFRVDGPLPELTLSNVWGSVRVRRGPVGEITVAVKGRLTAPDTERLERARELYEIDVSFEGDAVAIQVGDDGRHRRRDPCRGCRAEYQFDVVVPEQAAIDVGTVNDGRIDVAGVTGPVTAHNVNGPIRLAGLGRCATVEAINGDVDMAFGRIPDAACRIDTINGDITVRVPRGTNLDLSLELFNGRIVSAFDVEPLSLPAVVEASADDSVREYRIAKAAGVRIGRGGPLFTIASLNGDVSIQKLP